MEFCISLLSLILFFKPLNGQKLNNEFISVVGRSNFIFYGTVIQEDSSNINVRTTAKTAIVRVDEVIDATRSFFKMKGRKITVVQADSTIHPKGFRTVFYTTGWYYGKTLGVREVNNVLYNSFLSRHKKRILTARELIKDNLLRIHLKQASLVVKGSVLITNIDTLKLPPVPSEHDPVFRAAIIKVKRKIKGDTSVGTVLVYYTSSYDIMWENSPKPQNNTKAIFLLHQGQIGPGLKRNDYFLFDPLDIQPYNQGRKIKRLLKN